MREHLALALALPRTVADTDPETLAGQIGLTMQLDLQGRSLSAGQQRRLGLGIVLARAADLWLLDEPYADLDAEGEELLDRLVAAHASASGALLMAVHRRPVLAGTHVREITL